jgi:hypothetical protein
VADVSAPPTDQAPPPVPDPLAAAPEVPPAAEAPAPEVPAPPPVVPAPVPEPVLQSPPPAPAPEPVLQSPASTPAHEGGSGPTPPGVLTEPSLPVPAVELPALDPNPPLVEALPAGPQIPAGAALPTTGLPPFGSLVSPALDHPLQQAESQAADAAGPAPASPPALVPLEVPVEAPLMEIGEGILPPTTPQAAPQPARTVDPELGQAIKLMDDLAGVKAAMTMLAEAGRAPSTGAPPAPGGHGSDEEAPDPAPSSEAPPLAGGAPSAAAGSSAPSGGGSAALYALMFALAAAVLGLWGRLQLVPVHWRSVAVVALVERPG